ncbi:hydroxymethylglutaryl-CoA lyase, mitochondrial-like, partial [Pyrus x bretschneideri]|uniref:hydroxymethylglutaryl-CoA lyase, mitochondrial-like n=1 Tax=Pyrus x bretschneideri TaxID=225117 RepID=UPI00202F6865
SQQQQQPHNQLLKDIPGFVKIVEVGPRDGLQNEKHIVPTAVKVQLIQMLVSSGFPIVEPTSFVSPKWVPKLADTKDVMDAIRNIEGARFPVLTPNLKGFEAAIASGAKEVVIFASASESFSKSNINCSIEDSLVCYGEVAIAARKLLIPVRGYSSPVIVMCHSTTDTLAVHFHDTYGQALSNILASLQIGISTVDSSLSGLGGCPYAKGASGNVATEDAVYMLNGLGLKTHVDLKKFMLAGDFICKHLGRSSGSKTTVALSKVTAPASKL